MVVLHGRPSTTAVGQVKSIPSTRLDPQRASRGARYLSFLRKFSVFPQDLYKFQICRTFDKLSRERGANKNINQFRCRKSCANLMCTTRALTTKKRGFISDTVQQPEHSSAAQHVPLDDFDGPLLRTDSCANYGVVD